MRFGNNQTRCVLFLRLPRLLIFVTIVPCFLQLTFFGIRYLPKGLIGW
jgi:hypothetical protein